MRNNEPIPATEGKWLLSLWMEGSGPRRAWRATLESPRTGERLGFGSLEQLFNYLVDYVELSEERPRPPG